MHELGLCEAILDAVERRAGGRRVASVRVRIGALHRVVEPALNRGFSAVAAGTVAEGARVSLVCVPAVVACRACGGRTESEYPTGACPACGAAAPELSGGDELVLDSIELAARV
ncbi:MAG: hydrogenase maturation nickel metallochaperone HypA [Carbonactinosporaceae bacterium]